MEAGSRVDAKDLLLIIDQVSGVRCQVSGVRPLTTDNWRLTTGYRRR